MQILRILVELSENLLKMLELPMKDGKKFIKGYKQFENVEPYTNELLKLIQSEP